MSPSLLFYNTNLTVSPSLTLKLHAKLHTNIIQKDKNNAQVLLQRSACTHSCRYIQHTSVQFTPEWFRFCQLKHAAPLNRKQILNDKKSLKDDQSYWLIYISICWQKFSALLSHVRCVQVHRWLSELHLRGTRGFSPVHTLSGRILCLRKMRILWYLGPSIFSV